MDLPHHAQHVALTQWNPHKLSSLNGLCTPITQQSADLAVGGGLNGGVYPKKVRHLKSRGLNEFENIDG
jgi:hypothetical protein